MDGNNSTLSNATSPHAHLSPEARVSLIVLLVLFDIISIIANSMVLLTVYGNPRLRSNTNVFITNLCVVDLICGLVLMPLVIHSIALKDIRSGLICEFLGFLDAAYSGASSLTIALIALDRYHSIVNCLYYENIVTRQRTILGVVCIWILTLVVSISPIVGWGQYQYDRPQYKCSLRQPDKHGFLWFTYCTTVVFPYLVIVFCYTQIHLVARRHAKNMIAIHIHDTGKRIKAVSTTKTKLVYLVVGLYTVCWMPIYTIKLLKNVSVKVPDGILTLATLLSLVNGSCNPFIYALITSHFRFGMRRLYKRLRRKFGQPVASPSGDQSKSSWSVSKPISNLYRYFQENDAGNVLACIGKTTSQDFKMERQGELGQKMLNRQLDPSYSKTQTLQIPRKGKKTSNLNDRKDALERPFLDDDQKDVAVVQKPLPYLGALTSPSSMSNGRLSVLIDDDRDQCSNDCDEQGNSKGKHNSCRAIKEYRENSFVHANNLSSRDNNTLQIPSEKNHLIK